MGFLADLLIRIGGDATDLKRELSGARRDLQSWGNDLSNLGRTMTAAVTAPLLGVGVAALKTAGDLEQNSIAFKTMMGSAEAAQGHLNELKEFALRTPFQFNDLVLASKRMQAYGFSARETLPVLRNIGDASAALGLGAEGINRIVVALGQIKAKGAVQAEEMRQLAEAGIPAWQILARTLNTDVAGAMKLVEQRAVSAGVAVPAILAGINERFGGLMEQQSKTFLGQLSNLKDALTFTLQDLGKTLMPAAKSAMEGIAQPMLEGVKNLAAAFATLPPGMQQTAVALAAVTAAIGPTGWALGGLASGFSTVISLALKLPALLNPITLALAALATGAGIAFYELNKATAQTSSLNQQFSQYIAGLVQMESDFTYARKKLNDALDAGALGASEYAQALAMLEEREKKSFGTEAQSMLKDMGIALKVIGPEGKKAAAGMSGLAESTKHAKEELSSIPFAEQSIAGKALSYYIGILSREFDSAAEAAARYRRATETGFGEAPILEIDPHDATKDIPESLRQIILGTGEATRAYEDFNAAHTGAGAKSSIDFWKSVYGPGIKAAAKEMSELERSARRAFDSMARNLARNLVEWKGWGESIKSVGKDLATSFLEIMMRQLFRPLEAQFAKLAGKLSDVLFGGGSSAAAATVGATVPDSLKAVGIGATASAPVGGAASAASSTASGLMGTLGAVGSIGSMISGFIGNFQFAGMNKSLDLIEHEARYAQLHLLAILDQVNLHLGALTDLRNAFYEHHMPAMAELIASVQMGGGKGATVNFNGPVTFGPGTNQASVTSMLNTALTQAAAGA